MRTCNDQEKLEACVNKNYKEAVLSDLFSHLGFAEANAPFNEYIDTSTGFEYSYDGASQNLIAQREEWIKVRLGCAPPVARLGLCNRAKLTE